MKYNRPIGLTVVEFDEFNRFAARHFDIAEVEALKDFLSLHPESGMVIEGTRGMRKLRWALQGRGKSGGARIIYYYHSQNTPLLLLSGFAKNKMQNIGKEARNAYKKLIPFLVHHYTSRGSHGKKTIQ